MSEEYDLTKPGSRAEKSLASLTGDYSGDIPAPQSRAEAYLKKLVDMGSGGIDPERLPSYVDDVLEYDSLLLFPAEGERGKLYVATDTNNIYRWDNDYVKVAGPISIDSVATEGSDNPISSNAVFQMFELLGLSVDDEGYVVQDVNDEVEESV